MVICDRARVARERVRRSASPRYPCDQKSRPRQAVVSHVSYGCCMPTAAVLDTSTAYSGSAGVDGARGTLSPLRRTSRSASKMVRGSMRLGTCMSPRHGELPGYVRLPAGSTNRRGGRDGASLPRLSLPP